MATMTLYPSPGRDRTEGHALFLRGACLGLGLLAVGCGDHSAREQPPDPLKQMRAQISAVPSLLARAGQTAPASLMAPDLEQPWVFRWPLARIDITSPYGLRMHPVVHRLLFHAGVDFRARRGDPVLACGPGRVVKAGPMPLTGNTVILHHPGKLASLYAHLEGILVFEGQRVSAGAPVGLVGSTGRSTGPHLHLSVYRLVHGERVPVSPADLVGTEVDPRHPPDWPLPPVPPRTGNASGQAPSNALLAGMGAH